MIEAIDSFYNFVVGQMGVVAPDQKFNGYVMARDWPLTPVDTTGGLYLLYLRAVQLKSGTESQNLFQYYMQWVWLILGTDIGPAQQAQNRGDRFRAEMAIEANLRQAHFPGFCPKSSYASDTQGNVTATPVEGAYPKSGGVESVWWSRPRMMPRQDNAKSGVLYGACAVELFAYEDVNVALVA